jgi:hypothetical protein
MLTRKGVEEGIGTSLSALALDSVDCSASRPGCFSPWERIRGAHYIGSQVGSMTGLNAVQKRHGF